MAQQPAPSANRFAHCAEPSTDSKGGEHFDMSEMYQSVTASAEQVSKFSAEHHSHHNIHHNSQFNSPQHTPAPDLQTPLRVHVERVVREYFATLGDDLPTDLYELILREIELPLLVVTLEQTRGNQSKCAQILGLNRGTLRKKLKTYHLMD